MWSQSRRLRSSSRTHRCRGPSHRTSSSWRRRGHKATKQHENLLCLWTSRTPLRSYRTSTTSTVWRTTSLSLLSFLLPVAEYLHMSITITVVIEPPQKWGVRLPGSGSGDSRRSENACKHTYETFKTIISLKIKLLHFSLKITMIRSRMFFKR
jgi:hypothetical protein